MDKTKDDPVSALATHGPLFRGFQCSGIFVILFTSLNKGGFESCESFQKFKGRDGTKSTRVKEILKNKNSRISLTICNSRLPKALEK